MTLPLRTSLILLLAVALAACQKKSMLATFEEVPYLGLPASITHLHGADMSRLRTAQFFQDQLAQARQESRFFNELLGGFSARVGLDPINDVDFAALAYRGALKPNQPLSDKILIARGRFGGLAAKLEPLRQWLGYELLIEPPPFQKRMHPASNTAVYYLTAHSQFNEAIVCQIQIARPADDLLIVCFTPENMDATLEVIAGTKGVEGLHNNLAWIDKMALVKTTSTLWGIGDFNVPPQIRADLLKLPDGAAYDKIQNYLYSVDSEDELRIEVGFACDANPSAIALAGALEKARGQMRDGIALLLGQDASGLAGLPDKLLITPDQNTARMILRVPQDDIEKFDAEIDKLAARLPAVE